MRCDYCAKNDLTHINPQNIINVFFKITPQERLVILQLINHDESQHDTIALTELKNRFCRKCGEENEQEVDDDRYIYFCVNRSCGKV